MSSIREVTMSIEYCWKRHAEDNFKLMDMCRSKAMLIKYFVLGYMFFLTFHHACPSRLSLGNLAVPMVSDFFSTYIPSTFFAKHTNMYRSYQHLSECYQDDFAMTQIAPHGKAECTSPRQIIHYTACMISDWYALLFKRVSEALWMHANAMLCLIYLTCRVHRF